MLDGLILVGLAVALFVGFNIGGSNTGPAFGPAVGAGVLSKLLAGVLMSVFFFVGAWTIGRRVVDTLGSELVTSPGVFTVETSIVVLFFIGGALFVGNFVGVPASTSMTAVGAIAGLALAAGELNLAVMGEIAVWWIVAPLVVFCVSVMIGRYVYPIINEWVAITSSEGSLVVLDRSGFVPVPRAGPNTSRREFFGTLTLVSISCLMAFSSGTSNIANAVAPLFGPLLRDPGLLHSVGLGFQASAVASLGFLFWLGLIAVYPASDVAAFSFLSPVLAVGMGWLLLGEPVGPTFAGALVLVAVGIVLINMRRRTPAGAA